MARKSRICRPCFEGVHVGCDGPDDCDCTFCVQLRELEQVARDKGEIMWPYPPPEPPY